MSWLQSPSAVILLLLLLLSHFSRVRLLATPWTAAYQAPLSMGFSRQEYWSGVPLPSPNQPHYTHIIQTHNKYLSVKPTDIELQNPIVSRYLIFGMEHLRAFTNYYFITIMIITFLLSV